GGGAQGVHVAVAPPDQVVAGVGTGVQVVGGAQDVGHRLGLDFGGAAVREVVELGVGVAAPDVGQLMGEHHHGVRVTDVRPYRDGVAGRVGVAVGAGGGAAQGVAAGRDQAGQAVPQG